MISSKTFFVCLILILKISCREAMHLQGKISDAATRTSKSLEGPGEPIFQNNISVLKRNSSSSSGESQNGTANTTDVSFHPHLGEFPSSSSDLKKHSDQPKSATSMPKQDNQINGELESFISSKVTKNVITHQPGTNKIDNNNNKDGMLKSELESKSTTDIHRNNEQHRLHEHNGNDKKVATKTLESSVKSLSENDGVAVAKDDPNKLLRPTVTVFIEEKNTHGHTQRVIASKGDGVIESRTVHIDDTSVRPNANDATSTNHIISTDDSSKMLDNNEVSPDIMENNNAPAKEIEHNNYPATITQHKDISANVLSHTDHIPTITEHSDVSSDINIAENSEEPARTIQHNNVSDNTEGTSDTLRPTKVSSTIIENNEASDIKTDKNEVERTSEEMPEVRVLETEQDSTEGNAIQIEQETNINSQTTSEKHHSKITPTMAVLENTHDNKEQLKHPVKPAETNAQDLHNVGIKVGDKTEETHAVPEETTTIARNTEKMTTAQPTLRNDENDVTGQSLATTAVPRVRTPEDVSPLDIFTSDIKYQRFPRPMSLTTLKNEVLGKPMKKLYILEESEKKLFQHVRQLEAVYTIEDGNLYVSFLFRFIYSRKCQEIKKFKLGKIVGNTDIAMFEKEMKDGKTERIMFFSERPEDYVFFMSCTDMKSSPYACRDSYYITLDTTHDPPNQFPWADAANELEAKLSITFEDPRFIFNFVLLPCARR